MTTPKGIPTLDPLTLNQRLQIRSKNVISFEGFSLIKLNQSSLQIPVWSYSPGWGWLELKKLLQVLCPFHLSHGPGRWGYLGPNTEPRDRRSWGCHVRLWANSRLPTDSAICPLWNSCHCILKIWNWLGDPVIVLSNDNRNPKLKATNL